MTEEEIAEFWQGVKIGEPKECWEWQRGKQSCGYGVFKGKLTHRIALTLACGDPGQLHALHSCDNPPCCNPAHLRAGTPKENAKDIRLRNRDPRITKPFCDNGHPLDSSNTYLYPSGRRACRECRRVWQRQYVTNNPEKRKASVDAYNAARAAR